MNPPQKNTSIILGIDPGTRVTGYGVISLNERRVLACIDYGCIRPPVSKTAPQKYRIIFESMNKLLDQFSPDSVVVETQFVNKNPQSAIKLGMARGMVILAAALREIPLFEYAPTRAKQAVVGNGRASKQQVQAMVKNLLGLKVVPSPEDAADALALAICHGNIRSVKCTNTFAVN